MTDPHPYPGLLIAIDGIDGAGKTTLARALAEQLRGSGFTVAASKEPTDGPHGSRLRASAATGRLPVEQELELLEADRAEHAKGLIVPALQRGDVVILDRYYFSTAAYQGAAGLDPPDTLRRSEAIAPRPDVSLILDLPVEVALGRIAARGDVANAFERTETLTKCREIFAAVAGMTPGASVVDAEQDAEWVFQRALALVIAGYAEKVNRQEGAVAAVHALNRHFQLSAEIAPR